MSSFPTYSSWDSIVPISVDFIRTEERTGPFGFTLSTFVQVRHDGILMRDAFLKVHLRVRFFSKRIWEMELDSPPRLSPAGSRRRSRDSEMETTEANNPEDHWGFPKELLNLSRLGQGRRANFDGTAYVDDPLDPVGSDETEQKPDIGGFRGLDSDSKGV